VSAMTRSRPHLGVPAIMSRQCLRSSESLPNHTIQPPKPDIYLSLRGLGIAALQPRLALIQSGLTNTTTLRRSCSRMQLFIILHHRAAIVLRNAFPTLYLIDRDPHHPLSNSRLAEKAILAALFLREQTSWIKILKIR